MITGLRCGGKSTIAHSLLKRLKKVNICAKIVSSNVLRKVITQVPEIGAPHEVPEKLEATVESDKLNHEQRAQKTSKYQGKTF